MKIDSYSFGRIVIGGRAYTSDVIVFRDQVAAPWWRKEGHCLDEEDLAAAFSAKPDVLIIGTGYSGVMSVPETTVSAVSARGIAVEIEKTGKAVERYNILAGTGKNIVAALHITC